MKNGATNTNGATSTATQEQKATMKNVVELPASGADAVINLSLTEPTVFNFDLSDVRGMTLQPNGALQITMNDGSTLTVTNFEAARNSGAFNEISLADGSVMNLNKVYEGLSGETVVAETMTILKPVGAIGETALNFNVQEGKTYALGFDPKQIQNIEEKGKDLLITFKDGTTLRLVNFETAADSDLPPQMTLADGTVIKATDLVQTLTVAVLGKPQEDVINGKNEGATKMARGSDNSASTLNKVETAAGETTATKNTQTAQLSADQLAQIEPAAGTAGGGGVGNTGASFGSTIAPASLAAVNAVGPIAPTSLAFSIPEPQFGVAQVAAAATTGPNPPSLTLNNVQGYEDTNINLNLNTQPATSGSQLTIVVSGIPAGWTVTGPGTFDSANGTWTYTPPVGQGYTSGPILKPPANSDADIGALTVTVTNTVVATGQTSTASDTISVLVDAVADKPDLVVNNVSGYEDTAIPLNIIASLTDTDGSEKFTSAYIKGVPAGFNLSSGTKLANGDWQIDPNDLSSLTITGPDGYSGTLNLTVVVNNAETVLSGGEITTANNTNSNTKPFTVTFEAVPDAPDLVVNNPIIKEDGSGFLAVQAFLNDTDGSEFLTLTITGINPAWGVSTGASNGTYNAATGTWTITLPAGQNYNGGLTFTPPANSDLDMSDIKVVATSTESATGGKSSIEAIVDVLVDAVADEITLTAGNINGTAGQQQNLNIAAALTDLDGSEEIVSIKITGVPSTFSLTAGTKNADGSWTLTPAQLANLKLNTPAGYNGTFKLDIDVLSREKVGSGTAANQEVDELDNQRTTSVDIDVTLKSAAVEPSLTVAGSHQVYEDGSVLLPISATLNGVAANQTLTITLTGIPSTWGVTLGSSNGTYNATTGTWTITLPKGQNYSGGITLKPPADSDVDLSGLKVTATSTDGSTNASTSKNTGVVVDAVADAPTLTVANATGKSGTAIALNLTAALKDVDGSETLSKITIKGIPSGYTLNKGTKLANGDWELTTAQLTGLKLNVPANASTTLSLTASVTSTEKVTDTDFNLTNNTATTTKPFTVKITDDADVPTLTVAGEHKVYEDGTVFVPITAKSNGSDRETLTLTLTGIKAGWTVTLGTNNGTYDAATGTWKITLPANTDYSGGLTLKPPANSDVDLTGLKVTLVATEPSSGNTKTVTADTKVIVDAVADAPTLTVANATGKSGTAIALNIASALTDTDGSETLSTIKLTGIPNGYTLNKGTKNSDGSWTLTTAQLSGLTITSPANASTTLTITASVTSTEKVTDTDFDLTNNTATTTKSFTVKVTDGANPPTLTVAGEHKVYEDGSIFVPIKAVSNGSDRETLTLTLTGIKAGWTVTLGTNNGTYDAATGTWTIKLGANVDYNGGLTLKPPADSDVDLTGLKVTLTATEPSDGSTQTVSANTKVIVDAVADAPTLTVANASGLEGQPVSLNIAAALKDIDGSESLSSVRISGVPNGFTLSKGTKLSNGTWEVKVSDLAGLKLNTTLGVTGKITLSIAVDSVEKVTDTDFDLTNNKATTTKTLDVTLTDVANPPSLTIAGTQKVYEDGSVFVPIKAALAVNASPNEVLTVTITGIPSTWKITTGASNGTYNAATGTWTITLPKGTNYDGGLTFAPPANSDVDLTGLKVTATATAADSGTKSSVTEIVQIIVDAVADAPTLTATNVSGMNTGTIPLKITTALTDTDGSETLGKLVLSGIPNGYTLTKGTKLANGSWEVLASDLASLGLKAPAGAEGTFTITVKSTSTEKVTDTDFDLTNNTATTTKTFTVTVTDPSDKPTLTVAGEHKVYEDGSILLPIKATLNGTGETLTITLTGIKAGWTVTTGSGNGTYNATTGTWTITLPAGQSYNGGITVKPPADSDVDLTGLKVTATATKGGTTQTATADTKVIVDAVADAPTLTVANATGKSGTAIALNLTAALKDVDGSETLSKITIKGIPNGYTLSAGTKLANGDWELTTAQLTGLKLNVPANASTTLSLTASVTSTEKVTDTDFDLTNNTATTTKGFTVKVTDDADVPTLKVAGEHKVYEDGSVFLPIEATSNGSDRETMVLTLTGIKAGWTVTLGSSNGTYNATTGTWTISLPANTDYKGGLTLKPPADSDVDLTGLKVTLVATEPSTGTTKTVTADTKVIVDAVADAPTLTVANASGNSGAAIALNIGAALKDVDGSETLSSIKLTGIPNGYTLNKGTKNSDGSWTLTAAQLSGLTITGPANASGSFTIKASVTSTEKVTDGEYDLTNNTATTEKSFTVTVKDGADKPTLTVAGEHKVYEDGSVFVPIEAKSNGSDRETMVLTLTGIKAGWTVTLGTNNGTYNATTGTWTISLPANTDYKGGLTLKPPANSDVDLTGLKLTLTATEPSTGTTSTVTADTKVIVDAVADAPTLTVANASGKSGVAIALNIASALTDTDGSETLSSIKLTGIPNGYTLNKGTKNSDGSWTLTAAQLSGLTITSPANASGSFAIKASVTSTEKVTDGEYDLTNNTATTEKSFTVTVKDGADKPTLTVAGEHKVYEDGTVFVPITAKSNGSDRETLTLTLTGIKAGWTVTLGTNNGTYDAATGTWKITLPANTDYSGGLTLKPPANSDVDLTGLKVTLVATEPSDGSTQTVTADTKVIVDAVADAPTLTVANASGKSGTAIALSLGAALTDTDGSETLSTIKISGIPNGYTLSAGTKNSDGTWTLTSAQLSGLKLNVPANASATLTLTASVSSTEKVTDTDFDLTNNTATTTKNFTVTVKDDVNKPTLTVAGEHKVYEDGSVFLPIKAASTGSDRETLTITLTGIKAGWTVTLGTNNGTYDAGTGTWTIKLDANTDYNGGITLKPPADSDVDLTGLKVTVTATEPSTGTTSSVTVDTKVIVDAVADAPNLTANAASGLEGQPVSLNIAASLKDTDGSETLGNITIKGLPAGFSLSAGTKNADGSWTLTPAQLSGLKLNTVLGVTGTVNLQVSVTSTEKVTDTDFDLTNNTATTTKTLAVTLTDVANPPTLEVDGTHKVLEDGSIFVPIKAGLAANASPNEILTVTVSGIPSTWKITTGASNGTYNAATGTWTITLPKGTNYSGGLTFAPPADSDVDLTGLRVQAKATAPASGTTASVTEIVQIIVDAVADKPELSVTNTSVEAGKAVALSITTAPKDKDGSEVIEFVKISGLPSGFSLSAGTNLGGGVWQLTLAQLSGLKLNTPASYEGALKLTVLTQVKEKVTDQDYILTNNTNTNTATLTVTVVGDDVPVITNPPVKAVDEDDLVTGNPTVTGKVTGDFGNDGPGTFGIVTTGSYFTATGSVLGSSLTSCGDKVTVTASGNTYTGKSADGETVFTMVINADGTYKFTLFEPLDHSNPNSASEIIKLNFAVIGTDSDGDKGAGTITIDVEDSKPVANDDIINFCSGDSAVSGNLIDGRTAVNPGNAADQANGEGMHISVVQDWKGTNHTINEGSGAAIKGQYGTFYVFSNGSYVYVQEIDYGVARTENFKYGLTDCDGDTDWANVTIRGLTNISSVQNILQVNGTSGSNGTSGADFMVNKPGNGNSADTFNGGAGDDVMFGWGGNDTLNGGAGNDVLLGEAGSDTYTGGAGSDIFVIGSDSGTNGIYDTIKDFKVSEGDVIDLSGIVEGYNPNTDAISNFVRATNSGGGSFIQVNLNGWKNVAYVEGQTNLNVADLVNKGNIDVT